MRIKKKIKWFILFTVGLITAVLNVYFGLSFWMTNDQQGFLYFHKQQYEKAAEHFDDALWKGLSNYAAQNFEKAAGQFSRINTAEGFFNLGNAYAQQTDYPKAVQAYQRALELQPDCPQAQFNKDQVSLFIPEERKEPEGDMGSNIGADEIRLTHKKMDDTESTEMQMQQQLTDQQIQDLWMRQVQTTPADFLKSKFYFQYQQEKE